MAHHIEMILSQTDIFWSSNGVSKCLNKFFMLIYDVKLCEMDMISVLVVDAHLVDDRQLFHTARGYRKCLKSVTSRPYLAWLFTYMYIL